MKRRMLSAILAMAMIFAMTVPVSATDTAYTQEYDQPAVDVDAEIERALKGETDLEIDASDFAYAELVNLDGSVEPVDVFVTTRELSTVRAYAASNEEKLYATTAVAIFDPVDKDNSIHGTKQGVKCTLTIYWTDVLGIANNFRGVDIYWEVGKDSDTGKVATLSNLKTNIRGETFTEDGEIKNFTHVAPPASTVPYNKLYHISSSGYEDGWLTYRVWSYGTVNNSQQLNLTVTNGTYTIG